MRYRIFLVILFLSPIGFTTSALSLLPDGRYSPSETYSSDGSRWPLLKSENRFRIHLKSDHLPVLDSPNGDAVCSRLAANISGTVMNDGFGDDSGWYLVKWDSWPSECPKPPGGGEAWGFVAKDDAQKFDPAVDTILRDFESRESNCSDHKSPMPSIGQFLNAFISKTSGLKTQSELECYLKTYSTPHQADYERTYKPMIKLASEVFGVPSLLLTCVLRREGAWDKNARNGVAVGLGQQQPGNVEFVSKLIGSKNPLTARKWQVYMARLKAQDPQALAGCSGHFTEADRTCAAASIAATSVYLEEIEHELKRASRATSIEWEDFKSRFITAGAAYNIGNGFAMSAVRGHSEVDEWLSALLAKSSHSPEHAQLLDHVGALKNCMGKDNWNPPSKRDPVKKKPKNCANPPVLF